MATLVFFAFREKKYLASSALKIPEPGMQSFLRAVCYPWTTRTNFQSNLNNNITNVKKKP